MRDVVKFYQAKLSYDTGTDTYYMANSNAHETYWDVPNAITDLAAVRCLFPITIQVSQTLGLDANLRAAVAEHPRPTWCRTRPSNGAYLPHDAAASAQTTQRRERGQRADLALRPSPASAPPTTRRR